MDQVDSESRVVTAVDSTPKKLARQLDFSPMYKVPTANVVLPNHPQARLQLKIEAKVKPKVQPQTQPQPQLQAPQPQQVQVVRPIVRPPEVQMRPPHQVPVFQRDFSHPAPRQPLPAIHFEPKETQSIIKTEEKDVTPKKPKQCNCKNSKCLKLYCECFSAGVYCDGCNCSNCHNNIEHEPARQEAVTAALDRNPNAFRPKIAKSPHMPRNGKVETGDSAIAAKHNKGCHCKKSGCLKKYCECFQGNIPCSENCRCVDCKNCEGSEERRSLGYGDSPTPTIYYQPQATNAVVKEALGHYSYRITQVSKKRKNPEPTAFNPVQQNPQFLQRADYAAEFHKQENERNSSGLSSPANPLTPGSSKIAFSSLMADIIQPQFIKDLCSDMVVASAEIVKTHTENTDARQRVVAEVDHKAITTTQQRDAKSKDTNAEVSARADNTVSNQADGEFTSDIGSTSGEVQNERPMSPGMLALMCDETDTAFTLESEKRCQENEKASNFNSELHAKQEKIILTKFRDFLNHLIVCASVKESMHNNVRVQTEHVGTQNGTKASNNTIVRSQFPSSNPSATNGIIIRPPQLTASNPSGSSNSIIFRPQLPTSNPNNSVIFRPQLPTSNPNASNGVVIRPQAPTINHSVINSSTTSQLVTSSSSAANTSSSTTSQLVTSSSSAANTSSSSSYKQPEPYHSETSREESSLIK